MNSRIIFVLENLSDEMTFIKNKFLGLLGKGLDIHMVCIEDFKYPFFRASGDEDLVKHKHRIHHNWIYKKKSIAPLFFLLLALKCLMLNFFGTLNYFVKGAKLFRGGVFKRFYMDAQIVALKPRLIHYETGVLSRKRTYLGELLNCKQTVTLNGIDLNYAELDPADSYEDVWSKSNRIHCFGNKIREQAEKRGCPTNKLCDLIPPAINTSFFNTLEKLHEKSVGTESNPLRVLSVGRLIWEKGYEYALQAVRILKEQGVHCRYEIAGRGPYLEAVSFIRHSLGLHDEVNLLGKLSPQEVKQHMLSNDVFLHSAVSEGFSSAVIEAQAMQLPVVTSDANSLPEIVTHQKSGLVVPRRDPKAIAIALKKLAEHPELRSQMGKEGRRCVLHNFQLKNRIENYKDFFEDIAKNA